MSFVEWVFGFLAFSYFYRTVALMTNIKSASDRYEMSEGGMAMTIIIRIIVMVLVGMAIFEHFKGAV